MRTAWPMYDGLKRQSRLASLTNTLEQRRLFELSVLMLAGFLAALLTAFVKLRLGIPGHAIIRVVFPMAFGLAAAPRRGAGCVMSGSAAATAGVIGLGGMAHIGWGAMTGLLLAGPLLELAVHRVRRGWPLYVGLALAGLLSNLAALLVRGGVKYAGLDHAAGRPLLVWWSQAVFTYSLCGLLAGLISAGVWFRFRSGEADDSSHNAGSER